MGSVAAEDKYAQDNELPPHYVYVPEFYIGKYPVTNTQYKAFVKATSRNWEEVPWGKENHPAAGVSWKDAIAFCGWLSRETGQFFRLPTEAEWEKAARGEDGRIYPWGNERPDESRCNVYLQETTVIGRYSPQGDSPCGCADMAGNVWEWCQSLLNPYPYDPKDGREDLEAREDHLEGRGFRVLRGGSFYNNETFARCACRFTTRQGYPQSYIGFRVVQSPTFRP